MCNAEFAIARDSINAWANIGPKTGWNEGKHAASGQPDHIHRLGHAGMRIAQGNPCECCGDISYDTRLQWDPVYSSYRPGCAEQNRCCQPIYEYELNYPSTVYRYIFKGLNCLETYDVDCDHEDAEANCAAALETYEPEGANHLDIWIPAGHCMNISSMGYSPCCPHDCTPYDDYDFDDNWWEHSRSMSPLPEFGGTISEHISDVNYTLWFFDDK